MPNTTDQIVTNNDFPAFNPRNAGDSRFGINATPTMDEGNFGSALSIGRTAQASPVRTLNQASSLPIPTTKLDRIAEPEPVKEDSVPRANYGYSGEDGSGFSQLGGSAGKTISMAMGDPTGESGSAMGSMVGSGIDMAIDMYNAGEERKEARKAKMELKMEKQRQDLRFQAQRKKADAQNDQVDAINLEVGQMDLKAKKIQMAQAKYDRMGVMMKNWYNSRSGQAGEFRNTGTVGSFARGIR